MDSERKKTFHSPQEDKTLSGFWMNWVTGYCVAVALFGIVLAGGAFEATSDPVRILLGFMNVAGGFDLVPAMRFSLGVLGAVSIGWSVTMFAAIQAANQLDRLAGGSIWVMITASVVCWYMIDSTLSIATGFWINAIPNTILLVAFLIPVIHCGLLKS
jgi:hypothetical protein